jgi:hypothetical protein
MQRPTASSSPDSARTNGGVDEGAPAASSQKLRENLATAAVVVITLPVFGVLFYRETALSYSIGYNLYGASRILNGEVPYRDFHTLYPPATIYLNALLFKVFGTYLYTALLGVCVFKILTAVVIFRCALKTMSLRWALTAAGFSVVWLRPNGPFKAVPMHYGSLFLALALLLVLKYIDRKKLLYLAGAGICIGLLTLFKHNIGAYAFIGVALALVFRGNPFALRFEEWTSLWRSIALLTAGVLLPVLPVLAYLHHKGALKAMARTLLFGPGEFLANRLAAAPSPLLPLLLALLVCAVGLCLYWLGLKGAVATVISGVAMVLLVLFILLAPEGPISEIVFYAPVFILTTGVIVCRIAASRNDVAAKRLYVILVAAAAAFMESFPRFAREQSIAAMPYIGLLLLAILYAFKDPIVQRAGTKAAGLIAAYALPVALFVLGGRFFFQTFFDRALNLRSNTPLATSRGRGVYFPSFAAREIDSVVELVQQKVPEGGYIFAQSYAGSSYLFLADRRNPSGAQFWGGVGVTKAEREQTLASIQEKDVRLVITSDRDMEAERCKPMREYLDANFHSSARLGDVVILERGPSPPLPPSAGIPLN